MENGIYTTTWDLPVLPGDLLTSLGTGDSHVAVQVRELPTSDGLGYIVGFRVVRPTEDDMDDVTEWHNQFFTLNRAEATEQATTVRNGYNRNRSLDAVEAAKALLEGNVQEVLRIGHNRPFPDEGGMLPFMDEVHTTAKRLLQDTLDEVCDSWS